LFRVLEEVVATPLARPVVLEVAALYMVRVALEADILVSSLANRQFMVLVYYLLAAAGVAHTTITLVVMEVVLQEDRVPTQAAEAVHKVLVALRQIIPKAAPVAHKQAAHSQVAMAAHQVATAPAEAEAAVTTVAAAAVGILIILEQEAAVEVQVISLVL
jgi:hypothetical protein